MYRVKLSQGGVDFFLSPFMPKDFKTGAFGWYCGGQTAVPNVGEPVTLTITIDDVELTVSGKPGRFSTGSYGYRFWGPAVIRGAGATWQVILTLAKSKGADIRALNNNFLVNSQIVLLNGAHRPDDEDKAPLFKVD